MKIWRPASRANEKHTKSAAIFLMSVRHMAFHKRIKKRLTPFEVWTHFSGIIRENNIRIWKSCILFAILIANYIQKGILTVMNAGFFGWRGSDFRGSEQNITIGQSPKIWGNFSKICIEIKKFWKLLRKFEKKCKFFRNFF